MPNADRTDEERVGFGTESVGTNTLPEFSLS